VIGPVQLELIAIVGSSDASHGPALVTHVMSTPTPSTVGFTFEPHHDDARAPVSLFVDAVGPSGATKLCLGALRFESVPAQADAGAAAAEENAQRAAQRRGEPEKLPAANVGDRRSADKTAGTKERGKENAAPKRSTKKPTDKPAGPPKTSCNPPWYFDTKGIRRLKPECL